MKCEDPTSVEGECHHLQGEPGCQVLLNRTIPFRSGRADCLSEHEDRPYIATKEEVHADSMGDGRQTLDFFQDNFGFNGQAGNSFFKSMKVGQILTFCGEKAIFGQRT